MAMDGTEMEFGGLEDPEDFDDVAPFADDIDDDPDTLDDDEPSDISEGEAAETPEPAQLSDERPDEFGWLGKNREENIERIKAKLDQDPDAVIGGLLRRSDYSKKTATLAEELRATQAQQRELATAMASINDLKQAVTTGQTATATADIVTNPVGWAAEYEKTHGREPSQHDYTLAAAEAKIQQLLAKEVTPLRQQVEAQVQSRVQSDIEAQWAELVAQYPQLDTPEAMAEIAGYIRETNTIGSPNCVRTAAWAVKGEELAEARQAAKSVAVTKAKASVPPTPSPTPPAQKRSGRSTSNFDQIAAQQRRNPTIRNILSGRKPK